MWKFYHTSVTTISINRLTICTSSWRSDGYLGTYSPGAPQIIPGGHISYRIGYQEVSRFQQDVALIGEDLSLMMIRKGPRNGDMSFKCFKVSSEEFRKSEKMWWLSTVVIKKSHEKINRLDQTLVLNWLGMWVYSWDYKYVVHSKG